MGRSSVLVAFRRKFFVLADIAAKARGSLPVTRRHRHPYAQLAGNDPDNQRDAQPLLFIAVDVGPHRHRQRQGRA
jgi:hypothetical protein